MLLWVEQAGSSVEPKYFSLSSCFFPSFSFTRFRKLSWLWGCLICSMCAKSLQSCLTLCGPMDCSPPGSSGILQARILEWASMPSFRGSSWPLNPRVLCLLVWQAGLPLASHMLILLARILFLTCLFTMMLTACWVPSQTLPVLQC